jgi:hypothetical protein
VVEVAGSDGKAEFFTEGSQDEQARERILAARQCEQHTLGAPEHPLVFSKTTDFGEATFKDGPSGGRAAPTRIRCAWRLA